MYENCSKLSSIIRLGKSGFTNATGGDLINSAEDDRNIFFRFTLLTRVAAGFGYCSVKLPYFTRLGDFVDKFLLLSVFTETLDAGETSCFRGVVGWEDSADCVPGLRIEALPDLVIN